MLAGNPDASRGTAVLLVSSPARAAMMSFRVPDSVGGEESLCCRADDDGLGKFYGQAERAISTGQLHALLRFHLPPIKVVVFDCPS